VIDGGVTTRAEMRRQRQAAVIDGPFFLMRDRKGAKMGLCTSRRARPGGKLGWKGRSGSVARRNNEDPKTQSGKARFKARSRSVAVVKAVADACVGSQFFTAQMGWTDATG